MTTESMPPLPEPAVYGYDVPEAPIKKDDGLFSDAQMHAYAQAYAAQEVAKENESRRMFLARLENMQNNGDKWLTVESVFALLNDCDFLSSRP